MRSLEKVETLNGHSSRVLYMAMSPDGKHIVTGAGDETLRFWDLGYQFSTKKDFQSKKTGVLSSISLR